TTPRSGARCSCCTAGRSPHGPVAALWWTKAMATPSRTWPTPTPRVARAWRRGWPRAARMRRRSTAGRPSAIVPWTPRTIGAPFRSICANDSDADMAATLKPFQETVCAGIVARLDNVRELYVRLSQADPTRLHEARRNDAAMVLQAPTGAGKTLVAVEAMRRASAKEPVLWFWFAPFTGLVEQSRRVIASQAPELALFDLASDRRPDAVRGGGVFVVTWASLAARSAESRRARQTGDAGLAIDAVIAQAREQGLRIGCVVDEAHHGFQRATQARAFFSDVLQPDYALLMTATPRDADMATFERATGYTVGEPADWASVSRADPVDAGLLKRGVRMVRFIARDGDTAQLVDFEHLALRECTALHRRI